MGLYNHDNAKSDVFEICGLWTFLSVKPLIRGHLCKVKPLIREPLYSKTSDQGNLYAVKPMIREPLYSKTSDQGTPL